MLLKTRPYYILLLYYYCKKKRYTLPVLVSHALIVLRGWDAAASNSRSPRADVCPQARWGKSLDGSCSGVAPWLDWYCVWCAELEDGSKNQMHVAAVVSDLIGDPTKYTTYPAINLLIKGISLQYYLLLLFWNTTCVNKKRRGIRTDLPSALITYFGFCSFQ